MSPRITLLENKTLFKLWENLHSRFIFLFEISLRLDFIKAEYGFFFLCQENYLFSSADPDTRLFLNISRDYNTHNFQQ
jgi:hypothetical protein